MKTYHIHTFLHLCLFSITGKERPDYVEKKINPFLRADDSGFIKSVGIGGNSASESFGKIRLQKDNH